LLCSSSEAIGDDPESKHKIFLSRSGIQKEFVDTLSKALEERHYSFFDGSLEGLTEGEEFPDLIFKIVQQCRLFVVIISEDYFMSKWPMIELNAFLKAMKAMKSNINRGILPLYYGLSLSEVKDEKRRQRWFENWEKFARDDPQGLIKVEDWKYALDELTRFNGLSYDRESKPVLEYEKEIVSHICRLVVPDFKWEDSHFQGNAHEVSPM